MPSNEKFVGNGVKMRDVARKAGVSVMTVSYALRRHPRISKETTERVIRIAQEMGYQTHPLVSAMVREIRANRKVTAPPVIAYVVSYAPRTRWRHGIPGQFYEGAAACCRELGFGFELFELCNYGMSARRMSDVMKYRNICGLVVGPMPVVGSTIDLAWDDFPAVAIGYSMPSPAIHRVVPNHMQGILMAMERLQELGYQNIATVVDLLQSTKRGGEIFAAGINIFHRSVPPSRRVPTLFAWPKNKKTFLKWLQKHKVDAIVARTSMYMDFFNPGELTTAGIGFATLSWKPEYSEVAGINQNAFEVGRSAVSMLVQLIYNNERGIPPLQTVTHVNSTWVDGPSAPPKSGLVQRRVLLAV